MSIETEYQVVVLKEICQQMGDSNASSIFIRILEMKLQGYRTRHSSRFLPIGTHDFFGDHIMLCEKETLTPIVSSKVVSYKGCQFYNCSFPIFDLESVFTKEEWHRLTNIISERVSTGKDITYSGGFTINPEFKGKGLSSLLKDIYTGIHYLHHSEQSYDTMMGFGAPIVGTDIFFRTWGVKALEVNGKEMSPVAIPFANGLESILFWSDLQDLSNYKKEMAQKFRNLWENRIEYSVKELTAAA